MLEKDSIKQILYYGIWLFIGVFSLWLRQAFPIMAIGDAKFDDQLFVRLAASIEAGNWLGAYDNLTLAKGAAYSILIAGNHKLGLPLKMTEHFIYLMAAAYFSSTIGAHFRRRWGGLVVFVVLALIPTAWDAGTSGRVVRENLYISLSLLLVAMAIRLFIDRGPINDKKAFWDKVGLLLGFGLTAGIFWLTREEGVWLIPSISILIAYWLWMQRLSIKSNKGERKWLFFYLLLPMTVFYSVVGAVNSLNYIHYGVFRNNDFRSRDFQAAYGALSRIKHENWRRYVVFPEDARQKAYAVSPAAHELKHAFEGELGEFWRKAGCRQTEAEVCPEILSGWFMWALRDAVAEAGHYRNAVETGNYYRRLAAEINQACKDYPGQCLPERATLVPPWRWHYLPDTFDIIWQTVLKIPTAKVPRILNLNIVPSVGSEQNLELFETMTNGPLSSHHFVPKNGANTRIDRRVAWFIAQGQLQLFKLGLPTALLLWLVLTIRTFNRKVRYADWVVVTALWVVPVTRVGLLGFLEVTSIPCINMLYFMPALPVSLALFPCTLLWLAASLSHHDKY